MAGRHVVDSSRPFSSLSAFVDFDERSPVAGLDERGPVERVSCSRVAQHCELHLPQTRPGLQGVALLSRVAESTGARTGQALITHIAPQTPENQQELGQDAMLQPARREALLRARDSGTPWRLLESRSKTRR